MKQLFTVTTLILFSLLSVVGCSQAGDTGNTSEIVPGIPVKNTVTLVDLGAKSCIPCKMMAPILEELKSEYKGKAEVLFIDVWDQANAGKAKNFKVFTIPTQIVYDRSGKESFRHEGFLEKKALQEQLDKLLAVK